MPEQTSPDDVVRLPVREMSDEPAPQRAAQEGDLPPLLTDERRYELIESHLGLRKHRGGFVIDPRNGSYTDADSYFCLIDAIESEVRTAIAAAGGGMPQGWKLVPEETTKEMCAAFRFKLNREELQDHHIAAGYRAALAAAPEAPAQAAPSAGEVKLLRRALHYMEADAASRFGAQGLEDMVKAGDHPVVADLRNRLAAIDAALSHKEPQR